MGATTSSNGVDLGDLGVDRWVVLGARARFPLSKERGENVMPLRREAREALREALVPRRCVGCGFSREAREGVVKVSRLRGCVKPSVKPRDGS